MRERFGIPDLTKLCLAAALGVMVVGCSSESPTKPSASVNAVKNKIVINSRDEILWNGQPVSAAQLEANLKQSGALPVEPELQFEPEPGASYQTSAKVLNAIKDSKVTKFGFVGNEKYRTDEDSGESATTSDGD